MDALHCGLSGYEAHLRPAMNALGEQKIFRLSPLYLPSFPARSSPTIYPASLDLGAAQSSRRPVLCLKKRGSWRSQTFAPGSWVSGGGGSWSSRTDPLRAAVLWREEDNGLKDQRQVFQEEEERWVKRLRLLDDAAQITHDYLLR